MVLNERLGTLKEMRIIITKKQVLFDSVSRLSSWSQHSTHKKEKRKSNRN